MLVILGWTEKHWILFLLAVQQHGSIFQRSLYGAPVFWTSVQVFVLSGKYRRSWGTLWFLSWSCFITNTLCVFKQQDQYNMLENVMSSLAGGFDPSSNLYYSQTALMGLGGSHGNLQDHLQMRHNMLYSNCGGGVPNIILTGAEDQTAGHCESLWEFTLQVFILMPCFQSTNSDS